MNKNNLKTVLTHIKEFVKNSRPAYKDYLGEETVTTPGKTLVTGTLAAEGELTLVDTSFTGFVVGKTYQVTVGDVTGEYVGQQLEDVMVMSFDYASAVESQVMPTDYWAVVVSDGQAICLTAGTYIGQTITVSTLPTTTVEKKYDVKKLSEDLLPDKTVKDIKSAESKANDAYKLAETANTKIASKANASHAHAISDITYLQANLNSKQNTITGAASTVTSSNLGTNYALISNSSGKIAVHSSVTSTELGYLDGVTSKIQTQLNGKASSTHEHDYNDLTNKPCYEETIETEVSPRNTTSASTLYGSTGYYYSSASGYSASIEAGKTYRVQGYNGVNGTYTCYWVRNQFDTYKYYYVLGNPSVFKTVKYSNLTMHDGSEVLDTGGNWCFVAYSTGVEQTDLYSTTQGAKVSKIYEVTTSLVQLDEKFIPDTIARTSDTASLEAAKSYSDSGDAATLTSAKTYTDEQLAGLSQIQFITWEGQD